MKLESFYYIDTRCPHPACITSPAQLYFRHEIYIDLVFFEPGVVMYMVHVSRFSRAHCLGLAVKFCVYSMVCYFFLHAKGHELFGARPQRALPTLPSTIA